MNGPRKLISAVAFVFIAITFSLASTSSSDIYIAQNAQGGNTGADCADAHAASWFNTPANWGSSAGQIGPGTTVHLCGTFSGSAGVNFFTFQGGGVSGSVVTLKFEAGAILQAPYIGTAINLNSHSFILIDGGTSGLIQNTNNGDPAGGFAYQQGTTGIDASGSHDYEIKNLTMKTLYVKSDRTYNGIVNDASKCVSFNGSNVLIHDNDMSDAGWCLEDGSYGNGDTNVQIYNNIFAHVDHAIALAGGNATAGSFYIYNNQYHDPYNWDSDANDYHHNFVHSFNCSGGGGITALYAYNNYLYGNYGGNSTAGFFLEGGSCLWTQSGRAYFWNNVFTTTGNIPGLGYIGVEGAATIFNNTFVGSTHTNNCIGFSGSTAIVENNIFEGCAQIYASLGASNFTRIDYNIYADSSSGNAIWQVGSKSSSSFAGWQSACGCDAHSTAQLGSRLSNLSSTGVPSSGFIGIGAATNLSSAATGTMASLMMSSSAGNTETPVQRPAGSTPWDIGGVGSGGGSSPAPPTGLAASVQ